MAGPGLARGNFSISGSVRDAVDSTALNGIRVNLRYQGVIIESELTGNNGNFQFNHAASGEYVLEVDEQGYEPAQQEVTVDRESVFGVSLDLQKLKDGAASSKGPASGAISAHQLAVPGKARDAFEKGVELVRTKSDYNGAIAQFQRAIQIFPGYYEAYTMEGAAYLSLENATAAEEALQKAITLSASKYSKPFVLLAGLLNNSKRFAEAESASQQAVTVEPSGWGGYFELARAKLGLNRLDEAETNAVRARDLKPDNPTTFLLLAKVHNQLRNYTALLQDFDGYLKIAPPGPQAEQVRKSRDQLQQAMENHTLLQVVRPQE